MPDTTRPLFDSYSLPVQRRRQGPAAALSFAAHLAIAILVVWRGAELFGGGGGSGTGGGPRGGGGGGGRPAVSWFALPTPSSPIAAAIPPAPTVTVPTVAAPVTERVKLDMPPPAPTVALAPPRRSGLAKERRAVRARVRGQAVARAPARGRAWGPIPALARAAPRVISSPPRRCGRSPRRRA